MLKLSNALFNAADNNYITIPAPIIEARKEYNAITAIKMPPMPPTRADALEAAVIKARTNLAAGKSLPDAKEILDKIAAHERWEAETDLIAQLAGPAAGRLETTCTDHADEIITEHLRPALAETWDSITDTATKLPTDVAMSDEFAIHATKTIREAWIKLTELTARYAAIRTVQGFASLNPTDGGEWAELDNLTDVWPTFPNRGFSEQAARPPWPTEPRARLLWLARTDATPVALTVAERNQRWHDTYAEAIEANAARARHVHSMYAAN